MNASERRRRTALGLAAALAWHVVFFVVLVTMSHYRSTAAVHLVRQTQVMTDFVWLNVVGPGGGGGGGGNRHDEPARRLERPGQDRRSVPAAQSEPRTPPPSNLPEPNLVDRVIIPAKPLGASLADLTGLLDSTLVAPSSQGSGSGGGAGPGDGPGLGRGSGNGVDDGSRGGMGGDVYRVGNDVLTPVPTHIERPRYSNDAMRARAQGVVLVECVVRATGVCTDIHVVRSLHPGFGLDDEAMKAAALWRFKPGTRFGQPVPVRVRIELEFTMR